MTILSHAARHLELVTDGEENNPFVAWDNVGNTATTDVGSEQQSAAFALTGTTFDQWVATPSGGDAAIAISLSSAQDIGFVAIAAHNISDVGGTVSAEYSTDGGSSWDTVPAGTDTPEDNQAIAWRFVQQNAADWRILITGASGDVSIGVVFVGNELIIPQRIYQGYAPPITPNIVELQSNVSEGGHLLGSAVTRKGSESTASLTLIKPDFIRGDDWPGFQKHYNGGKGFFFAWRPTKYGDIHYAWRTGGTIAPNNSGPTDYMAFDMGMRFYDNP